MTKKSSRQPTGRRAYEATVREQELCNTAVESGEFDGMTDNEWVALCEKTAGTSRLEERLTEVTTS